jgi:hypothetical protein
LLLLVSSSSVSLFAQVIEAGGGTSSLYQAGGGSITVHAPNYDLTMGAGTIDGHFLEGMQLVKAAPHGGKYIFGDARIPFELPTDIFDTSHFILARGVGLNTFHANSDIFAFAGATATDYNSPLFDGAKAADAAGIFFLKKNINPHWQFFSDTVASKQVTQIEAVKWEPLPKLDVGFSGGVGANQPYGAGSVNFSRHWIDADAAYIGAGQQFHRVVVDSPLVAEPDRENVLITLKPFDSITMTGAHQNFLVPQYPSAENVRSSVDQGTAAVQIYKVLLNGALYHSTYQDESNHAVSVSAARDFMQRFHLMANYLASRPLHATPTNGFISTFSEMVTSRLTVNESLTTSGGHTGVTFGGQLLSNVVTINADYQTFYVPAQNNKPFEQALVLDVKMNLFRGLTLHGASFVDPTGHLRYTADANTVMARGMSQQSSNGHLSMDSAIMRGCVTDTDGNPVEGAAVKIDQKLIYTDSNGCFFVREGKPRTHTLEVVLTEFLAGGNWVVVSAPRTIVSIPEKQNAETSIKVVVKRARTVDSASGVVVTHPGI